jgi:pimeloyl-ACP methyl ester carboxylesterase
MLAKEFPVNRTVLMSAGIAAVAVTALAPAFTPSSAETTMPATESARPGLHFLSRPEGRIAYTDEGSGSLVVMVPGLGDLKEEYRVLALHLVAAGYRAVAIDIRGHGESSTKWSDYSSSAVGSDIVALLKELNAGPATLIGTSMGAGAAAWAAAEAPEAVNRLVLVGPFVREVPMAWWKKALFRVIMNTAFVGPWGPSAWGMYYASLYPTAKPADFEAYKRHLVANLKEPGRLAALQEMLAASKSDVEQRLNEVRAPTLVVMGAKDPDFDDPRIEADTVARLLKGRAVMIEGAGHYPHAEMPDTTAPAILDFLGRKVRV